MAFNEDLGQLRLHCPAAGLSLVLSSAARLSSIDPANAATLNHLPAGPPMHDTPWVSRGRNMALLLHVRFRSTTQIGQIRCDLQNRLTAALENASIWSQLQLKPSITTTALPSVNSLDQISIALSHDCPEFGQGPSSLHRIRTGVPSSHARPPDGVPHLTLDTAYLDMDFACESTAMSGGHAPLPPESSVLVRGFSPSTGLRSHSPSQSPEPQTSDIDRVLCLVDVALRSAISKFVIKGTKVIVKETSSFRRLEDICPAMWRPGYLLAIASRAVFLPAVSHTVSHVPHDGPQSRTLSAKLELLSMQRSDVSLPWGPSSTQKLVSIRMWQTMQYGLCNVNRGAKLDSVLSAGATSCTSPERDVTRVVEGTCRFPSPIDPMMRLPTEHEDALVDAERDSSTVALIAAKDLVCQGSASNLSLSNILEWGDRLPDHEDLVGLALLDNMDEERFPVESTWDYISGNDHDKFCVFGEVNADMEEDW
ncbi:hypothetical protein AAFC00_003005 [Neodothiora populina]|uniref:Uncharacterized protein n=1 Tax=Neodothiora populina TaxID=2781224 RepID=A0ABR3PA73_9PEZI